MAEERKDEFLERLWEAYSALLTRERRRISQAWIAQQIASVSGQATRQDDISRWLRGLGRPSFEELPATASVLGVRYQWLGFNDGPMLGQDGGAYVKPHAVRTPRELERIKPSRRKGSV